MEEGSPSITALVTAFVRAYHVAHDSPAIFDDALAGQILTPEECAFLEQNLAASLGLFNPELAATHPDQATALDWVMKVQNGPIAISRARYVEDCLESAVREGVEQYVILGAGLETFPFRRSDLLEHLEVFELDHPATQEFKKRRLSELGWTIPSRLHFVPADLRGGRLSEALDQAGYDRRKPSFFGWPGVTYYLDKTVLLSTFRSIVEVAAGGSAVVFDYLDRDALTPDKTAPRMRRMQAVVERVGEPIKTALDPGELVSELARVGLTVREDLAPADIEARYFVGRTDGYHAFEHVHFAWAEVGGER